MGLKCLIERKLMTNRRDQCMLLNKNHIVETRMKKTTFQGLGRKIITFLAQNKKRNP